ncbi:sigma-70 family RNA polymerase sigma factor [Pigmentiphaga soli]|uniref:Sigma-70 family RNA polymerase sigma factor n=1 Tax=Pigmentiphaga soli TaxID=1007095 RepID=A0ABP8HIN6_9BURK
MTCLTCDAPATRADAAGTPLRDVLVAHYERLHRRLARRFGCPDLASECLHEAWLRLGEAAVPAALHSPAAYIHRVACNLALDHLRSERPAQYGADAGAQLEQLADAVPGPEDAAQSRAELEAVDRAFRELPPRHQSVLLALRIDGHTRQEVADLHHLSLRTVDTALRQALQQCAGLTGRPILAGVSTPRRQLPVRRGVHSL